MISDVVYHQIETIWIPINKYFIVHILQFMTPRKHGFKGTALDVAQGRSPNTEVVFATNIKLQYIINRLYLTYSLLFFHPCLFLFL